MSVQDLIKQFDQFCLDPDPDRYDDPDMVLLYSLGTELKRQADLVQDQTKQLNHYQSRDKLKSNWGQV